MYKRAVPEKLLQLRFKWLLVVGLVSFFLCSNFFTTHAQKFVVKPLPNIATMTEMKGRNFIKEPYAIEVDSMGFIHFVGGFGLIKYSGRREFHFVNGKGYERQVLTNITKDWEGNHWLSGFNGIARVMGDSVVPYPLPDKLKRWRKWVDNVYMDSAEVVHLAIRYFGYVQLTKAGELIENSRFEGIDHGHVVTHLADGTPFHFFVRSDERPPITPVYYLDSLGKLTQLTEMASSRLECVPALVEHNDGAITFSTGGRDVIRLKRDSLLLHRHFDYKVMHLFLDSREVLWIGTLDRGLYECTDDSLKNFNHYLDGAAAVAAEDLDGGLWIKSDSIMMGLLALPAIPNLSERNGYPMFKIVQKIVGTDDDIFLLTSANGIYSLKGDTAEKLPEPNVFQVQDDRTYKNQQLGVCYDHVNRKLWGCYRGMIARWDNDHWTEFRFDTSTAPQTIVYNLAELPNGGVLAVSRLQLFRVEEGLMVAASNKHNSKILDVEVEPSGKVWVSCENGLWTIEAGKFVRPMEVLPDVLKSSVYRVIFAQGEVLIMGHNSALYRITKNEAEKVIPENGNSVLKISKLSVDPNGDLWAGSIEPRGTLLRIRFRGHEVEVDSFEFDHLAARRIREDGVGLLVTKSKIYWGGHWGLFIADKESLRKESRKQRPFIYRIFVNHKKVPLQRHYDLTYNENFLRIQFDVITYPGLPVEYRYQLEGMDSTWHAVAVPEMTFSNVSPGDYTFRVQSRIPFGLWSESAEVTFFVEKPYWQTWWFRTGAGGLFFAFIYLLFQLRSRQIRQNEQQKSKVALEMSRLELKAVKAQLNPHFIFNSITSVMYYLSKNQPEQAENYLQRFAKLIRSILENSEKQTISLQEEVELMRHYVSLESERFSGSPIDFDVSFEKEHLEMVQLPPALFQPYLENAIWHGLQHKEGDRIIRLSGVSMGDKLEISIEDNGIGRVAARERGTKNRAQRSFGMMIATKRIKAFSQYELEEVVTEDLLDDQGNPAGTRVSFRIPLTASIQQIA